MNFIFYDKTGLRLFDFHVKIFVGENPHYSYFQTFLNTLLPDVVYYMETS